MTAVSEAAARRAAREPQMGKALAKSKHRETDAAPREPIGVAVVDKSPLVLSGLKAMFGKDPRFSLVISATDGERFIEALDRVEFDVGVIGWDMPFFNGGAVLRALKDRPNAPRIVVYTGNADPTVARDALELGAAGFCGKGESTEELIGIVLAVAAGRLVFPFGAVRDVEDNPLSLLTKRELELLGVLASGDTNAQLAEQLGVSVNTVKFHLRNLYGKLSINNRAQAVALHMKHAPRG